MDNEEESDAITAPNAQVLFEYLQLIDGLQEGEMWMVGAVGGGAVAGPMQDDDQYSFEVSARLYFPSISPGFRIPKDSRRILCVPGCPSRSRCARTGEAGQEVHLRHRSSVLQVYTAG